MSDTTEDLYQFTLRAVDRPLDSYYVTNWDRARNYDVVAATEPEAYQKLWNLLGDAGQHRTWTAVVKGAKDLRVLQAENGCSCGHNTTPDGKNT